MTQDEWDIDDGSTPDCFILWPTEGELIALLDADLIPYRIGFTLDEDAYSDALMAVQEGEVSDMSDTPQYLEAINRVDATINLWVEKSGADACIPYLTDCPEQARYDFAFTKKYKDRTASKPPFFKEMKEHIRIKHKAVYCTEYEADDGMSIEQCKSMGLLFDGEDIAEGAKKTFANTIIVSVDKDLKIIPGWHYDPVKDIKSWVTEFGSLDPVYDKNDKMTKLAGDGLMFFYSQILVGDAVDTYPGLPRCGPVKAYNTLNGLTTEKELWIAVLDLFKKKYKEEMPYKNWEGKWRDLKPIDLMVEQGRLAWMQRKPNEIWREDKNTVIRRSDNEWRECR